MQNLLSVCSDTKGGTLGIGNPKGRDLCILLISFHFYIFIQGTDSVKILFYDWSCLKVISKLKKEK